MTGLAYIGILRRLVGIDSNSGQILPLGIPNPCVILAFLRIWTINSALFIEGFSLCRLNRFNILESFEDFWW